MKKLLLQAVAISLLLILSCKSKNERSFYLCTFSVIFSDSDVQSKEEILYTSAGEYSPRPDDINEIRVPLYESVLYLDGKILKGRIHHFPMSDSIEFIVDKETYKPKDYIAVINNAEKENLHFSILGNSDFENISVKYRLCLYALRTTMHSTAKSVFFGHFWKGRSCLLKKRSQ